MTICSVPECDNPSRARGWCTKHYTRWMNNGTMAPQMIRNDDLSRFWSKVDKRGDGECWPWTGALTHDGYGRFRTKTSHEISSVVAYRLLIGPIPEGMQVDHVFARGCTRRDCVNPAHLEAVTVSVNIQRSAPGRRTHCPRGHEYTPENTSYTSGTGRTCVICNRERNRRARARRNAALAEADRVTP
jgi:hypothetical protein